MPLKPADRHHLALVDRVLELDEGPGDDVLHQLLGAEADRQAKHAGAREQRRDVHPHLREHEHDGHGRDHHRRRVAQQGEQRAHARARLARAVAG